MSRHLRRLDAACVWSGARGNYDVLYRMQITPVAVSTRLQGYGIYCDAVILKLKRLQSPSVRDLEQGRIWASVSLAVLRTVSSADVGGRPSHRCSSAIGAVTVSCSARQLGELDLDPGSEVPPAAAIA